MKKLFAWIGRNERHISTAVFVGGFALDVFGYTRVDLPWVTMLFTGMLIAAALCIILSHALHRERPDAAPSVKRPFHTIMPIAAQFFIGGLLSGCLIFYTRSASLFESWPFILLLLVVFVGNELFHKYRERLTFQCLLLFFTLYAYAIFELPIARGQMSSLIFFESGIASAVVFGLFLGVLYVISATRLLESLRRIGIGIASIFIIVNVCYFTGILPPLPLSLRDAGIYHSITKISGGYEVSGETAPRFPFMTPTVHHAPGTPLYAYSAVFAPVRLATPIVHRWQRYDDSSGKWQTVAAVTFPISGGRDNGYRGYSMLSSITAGEWRVSVETQSGSVLGRERFNVVEDKNPPALYTEVK